MRLRLPFFFLPAALLALAWLLVPAPTRPAQSKIPDPLDELIATLEPMASPLPKPDPDDWLANYREPGQTYAQWRVMDPVVATPERHTIVIQPLGDLDPAQREVMELAAEWLGVFFGLPYRLDPDLPSSLIPASARRLNPWTHQPQVHAPSLLYGLLAPRLPADAFCLLGFTGEDLYPEASWNFVFGQALLRARAGVWSMHRFGDPGESPEAFRTALLRTMKLATHETGHNFTMHHCTAHACNMNGTNNLSETDRSPVWFCPECLAKLLGATGADPEARFEELRAFCLRHGLEAEACYYSNALRRLRAAVSGLPRPQGPEL
ncbi:MAG: archaemetzincin [Pseudomonadota bacterium]